MKKFFLMVLLVTIQFVTVGQDLSIVSIDGTKSIKRYAKLTLSITFQNGGTVNISKSTITSIFLSTDNVYNAGDLHLGDVNVGSINAGQSKAVPFTSGALISLPVGSYYLITNVDKTNLVAEINETNNVFVDSGYNIETPDLDLYFTSFRLDKLITAPQDVIYPSFTVANKGETQIYVDVPITFYLSQDQVLDGSDMFIETYYNDLSSGNKLTSRADQKIRIPGNVIAGSYYLIGRVNAKANGIAAFQEVDITNNIVVSEQLSIISSNVDLDFSGQAGRAVYNKTDMLFHLYLVFSIRNGGTTNVSDYQYTVFISRDNILDATDYNLSESAWGNHQRSLVIPAGETINQSIELVANPSDPNLYGSFYTIVKVNGNASVSETNYSNNLLVLNRLSFWDPSWDHGIARFSLIGVGSNTIQDIDEEIMIDMDLRNSSSQEILDVGIFTGSVMDLNGNTVQTAPIIPIVQYIPPGTTQSGSARLLFLEGPLRAGTYFLQISNSQFPGFEFTTVLDVVSSKYTISGSVQGEDGVPITKGEFFLYKRTEAGLVSVTQQTSPTLYSDFNFTVARGEYALYFSPDATAFSEYVPTVMTKSLSLSSSSFLNITTDKKVNFQILKTHPVEEGSKFIEGNISASESPTEEMGATSRTSSLSLQRVTVILFSETGEIIGHTKTNGEGHYKFDDLPNGLYQVLPVFPFDLLQAEAPTTVDITSVNAQADFRIEGDAVIADLSKILLEQSLSFVAPSAKKYKDEPFQLDAASDVGLPIIYSSSNPAIAEIIDNLVVIKGAGEVVITASQIGNEIYQAVSTQQVIFIDKADQVLSFEALEPKTYGDATFALSAIADSNLPVTYSSSNEGVAEIVEGRVVIRGAGTTVIEALQSGNELYTAAVSKEQTLYVGKASQTIPFETLPAQVTKDDDIALPLNSSAGLPIFYTCDNEDIAVLNGNVVKILKSGDVTITATQPGNNNYEAALPVAQILRIEIVLGTEPEIAALNIGPNPTTGKLKIHNTVPIHRVWITDQTGRSQPLPVQQDELDIQSFNPGVYLVIIQTKRFTKVVKIIKE